jgi:hypothetical protein
LCLRVGENLILNFLEAGWVAGGLGWIKGLLILGRTICKQALTV